MLRSPEFYQSKLAQLPKLLMDADQFQILPDAISFRQTLHQQIKDARSRIYISSLYVEDDEAGRDILRALFEAKQQNPSMQIKVFVDFHRAQRGLIGHTQQDGNAAMYRKMAAQYTHQIEILGVPINARELFGVLHLKGFIFDDTLVYSGASLNDIYLHQDERYRIDRYHVLKQPALATSMAGLMDRILYDSTAVHSLLSSTPAVKTMRTDLARFKLVLRQAHYQFGAEYGATGDQLQVMPLIGFGKRHNELNRTLTYMIGAAQREVVIMTPYFNLPRAMAAALTKAMRRGVRVKIIIGDKQANDFYIPEDQPFKRVGAVPYVYEIFLRRFLKKYRKFVEQDKLQVYLWKHETNSYHLKGMIVDFRYHMITGNNLNPRAWALDLENGVLIQDDNGLIKKQSESELNKVMANTTLVHNYKDLQAVKEYPLPVQKFLGQLRHSRLIVLMKRLL